jgi:hypothetical protein
MLRNLVAPALLSLVTLAGCAKRNTDADSSIGAPEPLGAGASVSGPGGGTWTTGAEAGNRDTMAARPSAAADGEASVSGMPAPPMEKQKPGLGTAYGEQRFSTVHAVQFRRANPTTPAMLLSMRYNDAEGVNQISQWKTGAYPQRATHQSGQVSLTLRDEAGSPLPAAQVAGEVYAVGEAGARYTIGVENHSALRYEVVASVDGLDVLDGGEADFSKRGYLIDPYTSFVIEGWRTSDDTVAAFRFSDMDSSYAERMGKGRNIGVIGVAFFPEQGQAPHDELRRRDQADPFPNRYAPPPPAYRGY